MKDDTVYLRHIQECIDVERIWEIMQRDVPELKKAIVAMLEKGHNLPD